MYKMARSLLTSICLLASAALLSSEPVHLQIDIYPDSKKDAAANLYDATMTCTDKYAAMPDHTMCTPDSPLTTGGEVTPEEKEIIVDLHNRLRAGVNPPPTDMLYMVWDENLAVIAQKWAGQCVVGHDAGKSRAVPGYGLSIGQNVAGGINAWEKAILAWYNEVDIYTYGVKPTKFNKVGHYIQLVQNTTSRIGCGYAECRDSRFKQYYVCNYALGNAGRGDFPYTAGRSCAGCPNSCKKGLCDCAGKLCFNGGRLDHNTCTCSCKSIYAGPACQTLICPEKDKTFCRKSLTPEDCKTTPAYRFYCPYMCGLCAIKTTQSPTIKTLFLPSFRKMVIRPNPKVVIVAATSPSVTFSTTLAGPIFTSSHNCTYRGERPKPEKCIKYGMKGLDREVCGSQGGNIYSCVDCQYLAVRTRHCPVMCGTCDAPCEGKNCANGGQLNTFTCQCECIGGYSGRKCGRPPCRGRTCNNGGKLDTKKCTCACPAEFAGKYCGLAKCGTIPCKNGGNMNYKTCKCNCKGGYSGKYCGKAPCKGAACSNGGRMDFDTCTCKCPKAFTGRYCNAVRCGSRVCSNGGKMMLETCTCRCVNNYEGKYCNKFVCPSSDKFRCRKRTLEDCSDNVTRDQCPFLCKRCGAKRSQGR